MIMAKKLHLVLKMQLVDQWKRYLEPLQCRDESGMGCDFVVQALLLCGKLGKRSEYTTMKLFFDVKSAYHRAIGELLVVQGNELGIHRMKGTLHVSEERE